MLLPDGPYGPIFQVKKGVLHMALQSQVPIIPLRAEKLEGCVPLLWYWDKKLLPLPFSKLSFRFGKPISVTNKNDFEKINKYLQQMLKNKL